MPPRKLSPVPYRPDPTRNAVIDCRPDHAGPYLRTEGEDDCVCGNCGHTLIAGSLVAYLTLYICCPACGVYNLADGMAGA